MRREGELGTGGSVQDLVIEIENERESAVRELRISERI